MLSYRHAFHAGNHADVLKHLILVQIAGYFGEKPASYWIIDTHAGAGRYLLDSDHARKLGEYKDGIGRLWHQGGLPPAVAEYVDFVRELNPDGKLKHYPGSPWLAFQFMRDSDRLKLFELHSTDQRLLQEAFREAGRKVTITSSDGLAGLKALLPPAPRRALVLIDPSYETKPDYIAVINALKDSLKRFPTGCYALWYPLLAKIESRDLPGRLKGLGAKSWLNVTLSVKAPARNGLGMSGSGMFIINPPWTLEKTLHESLPTLTSILAQDDVSTFTIESQTA